MTNEFNTELAEQEREKRYREASEQWEELEQKRLKEIFPTLDVVKSNVEKGDRKAMLELLTIAANSLRTFDALPQEARESLADCLETMGNNLGEAKGFLPVQCGRPRTNEWIEFADALSVELYRRFDGNSREEAIGKVSDNTGRTESLLLKRWKLQHKSVNESLELTYVILQERGVNMPIWLKPKRKRIPKRVR